MRELLENDGPVLPKCIERAEQSRAPGSRIFKARIAVDRRGEFFQALAEINRINYINI
jgi:2-oxo-4-hydroxy-4-carboxy--5-ureidoimidazoline (OHCU) decarboxylase